MIFKKKYKRSDWMEGLILAEELYKDGWDLGGLIWEFYNSPFEEGAIAFCVHMDTVNKINT